MNSKDKKKASQTPKHQIQRLGLKGARENVEKKQKSRVRSLGTSQILWVRDTTATELLTHLFPSHPEQ